MFRLQYTLQEPVTFKNRSRSPLLKLAQEACISNIEKIQDVPLVCVVHVFITCRRSDSHTDGDRTKRLNDTRAEPPASRPYTIVPCRYCPDAIFSLPELSPASSRDSGILEMDCRL